MCNGVGSRGEIHCDECDGSGWVAASTGSGSNSNGMPQGCAIIILIIVLYTFIKNM